MTTNVRDPRDLVAIVPHLLGFHPRESAVLVSRRRGAGSTVGLTARVDLPRPGEDPREAARALAGHLQRDGAHSVLMLVYAADVDGLDAARMIEACEAECAAVGAPVAEVLGVDAHRVRSLRCGGCCPAQGWPLGDVLGSPITAELVAQGSAPVQDRASLAGDVLPTSEGRRRHVGRVMERLEGMPEAYAPGRILRTWRAETVQAARAVRGDHEVRAGHAALLLSAIRAGHVRDAVMLDCVAGEQVAEDLLNQRMTHRVDQAFDALFGTGSTACAPDTAVLAGPVRVLVSLARQAPPGSAAEPLAVLAWLAWWAGQGGRAAVLAERALLDSPGHGLACLVTDALDAGTPPAWVRQAQRRTARQSR